MDDAGAISILHSTRADAETVEELFQLLLGRAIGNDEFKARMDGALTLHQWIHGIVFSDEFRANFLRRHDATPPSPDFIADADFRTPRLRPASPAKLLITGSCLSSGWVYAIEKHQPDAQLRHVLTNNASELEDIPAAELRTFDFQLSQFALRAVVSDHDVLNLRSPADGGGANEEMFAAAVVRMKAQFDGLMKYKNISNLPVFVANFMVPQINPLGSLLPRFDLSNFVHFVERLNAELARFIEEEPGVYLLDFDAICASLGKRYIMDEITSHYTHSAFIGSTWFPNDLDLTPHGEVDDIFRPKTREAVLALYNTALSMFEVLSPTRKIKIVIFDLDGTLWRGVAADADDIDAGPLSEGWPLGMIDAAAFLKKRGVLIAIASKNDPALVRDIWAKVYGRRFPLDNFVSVKASWGSKIDSVAAILRETNLLPENALFVDDNPVEREQIRAAFPEIAVIQGPISTWKRTLLWSAELQTPHITDEGASRTQSVQKVMAREAVRAQMSPQDYLQGLNVQVQIDPISSVEDKKFARAYELLNKTNQFNTTGRRWTQQELAELFSAGGRLVAASVSDRLSDYGLTALRLEIGGVCQQIVMSCRVFGLKVEHRLLDHFLQSREGRVDALIAFRRTERNGPAASFLASLGLRLPEGPSKTIDLYPLRVARPPASA